LIAHLSHFIEKLHLSAWCLCNPIVQIVKIYFMCSILCIFKWFLTKILVKSVMGTWENQLTSQIHTGFIFFLVFLNILQPQAVNRIFCRCDPDWPTNLTSSGQTTNTTKKITEINTALIPLNFYRNVFQIFLLFWFKKIYLNTLNMI